MQSPSSPEVELHSRAPARARPDLKNAKPEPARARKSHARSRALIPSISSNFLNSRSCTFEVPKTLHIFLGVQRGLSGEIGWNEIEDVVFLSTLQVVTVQKWTLETK